MQVVVTVELHGVSVSNPASILTEASAKSTAVGEDDVGTIANISVSSGSSQSRGQSMNKPSASSSVTTEETMQMASHDSRIAAFSHTSGSSSASSTVVSTEDAGTASLMSRTSAFQCANRSVNVGENEHQNASRVGTTTSEPSFTRKVDTIDEAGKASRSSIITPVSAEVGTKTSETSFVTGQDSTSEAVRACRVPAFSHESSGQNVPILNNTNGFIGNIKDFVYTSMNTVRYDSAQGKVFEMKVPEGYRYPDNISTNRFFMFGSFNGNLELLKQFCPQSANVFDPFAGHGDRALFFTKWGVRSYIGNDTNANEWDFLNTNLMPLINKYKKMNQHCEVRVKNSMEYEPELENTIDFIYTSPPYFDFEVYDGFAEQIQGMQTYDDFHREFSTPIFTNVYKYMKDGGIVILQTEKGDVLKQKWMKMMTDIGFKNITENDLSNEQKHGINKTIQEICIFVKGDYKRTDVKISTNTLF